VARYDKGVTLSDAAGETGVRETHLLALERNELEAIGLDAVYVRGILRTYAAYLGLDAAAVLAQHRAQVEPEAATAPAGRPPSTASDGGRLSRRRIGALVGAVLMIAIVAGATSAELNLRGGSHDGDAAADAQAAATTVTASEAPQADTSESASEESAEVVIPQRPEMDGLTMKLEFTDTVWIRVLVDGENKLEGIMRPGAVTQFTAEDKIELRIGVAEAVEFSLNGAWYGNIASDINGPVDVSCTPEKSCEVVRQS
jgi:cytoskeletal protein RodZ